MRKVFKTGIKPKKEKISLFGIEEDILKNNSIIAIEGNENIHIDGFRCIAEYTDEIIKINLLKGILTVTGNRLCICSLENDEIIINGNICTLEFC